MSLYLRVPPRLGGVKILFGAGLRESENDAWTDSERPARADRVVVWSARARHRQRLIRRSPLGT